MPTVDAFRPDWASPPGETIADLLDQKQLSAFELAKRMDRSDLFVRDLLHGHTEVTQEVASLLEANLGGSAQFWLSRESQYRQDLSALQPTGRSMSPEDFLRAVPLGVMEKFGWIKRTNSSAEAVKACLEFYDVADIGEWQTRYYDSPAVTAFRTSRTFESEVGAIAAWLRYGEMVAASIQCAHWSASGFRKALSTIRGLTRKKHPSEFMPQLVEICASCGVAVVVARAPEGCRASGAARFLSHRKALLLLSFRHLSDDHFWFSFFHEAGHLLLHDRNTSFVDGASGTSDEREKEANEFAACELIPGRFQSRLLRLPVDGREVIRFAREVGVAPGIVVGQLQHLGRLRRNQLNNLKRRYTWSKDSS
jgi:HTH-type transcriptional regulator/antitoxin HigA